MKKTLDPKQKLQLLELWERMRDGHASVSEVEAIDAQILADKEVRAFLAEAVLMEAELRHDREVLLKADEPLLDRAASRSYQTFRMSHALAAGVAAGIAVLLSWSFWLATEPSPVATLVNAQACKWGNSALPTMVGSKLFPGQLELLEGMATLRFKSGAEVVLEAPASFEVVSTMEGFLRRGTVVAEVPPAAKGFTIRTPETTIVDYGTRFGVSAGEDGKCLVHVMEGLVEVRRNGVEKVRMLRAGRRLDFGGMLMSKVQPEAEMLAEPDRWLPPPPMTDIGDGWQMITTAFGRGKDTYIQSDDRIAVTGQESFMRVKYSSYEYGLARKAYIGFDLSNVRGQVAEAEFVLHLEPSDLGYASLVPDCVFTVFGLTDESRDDWEEDSLSWASAPANAPDAEFLKKPVPGKAVALGQFVVPQGQQIGPVSIQGDALAEFINQDTNQMVTLIVCRETDEPTRNGLVHAFATKENPRSTPPMLRLRVVGN